MDKRDLFLSKLEVKPVSITRARHGKLTKELPVYDAVRRWLEAQPTTIRLGCQPVRILRELLEQCGKLTTGTAQEQQEAIRQISSLLE